MRRAITICLLTPLALSVAAPGQARRPHDFGARDVVIWSEPREGSGRNGYGQPGQGFESEYSEEHLMYRCGDYDSALWHHGSNATTRIVGWVPACHLIDHD